MTLATYFGLDIGGTKLGLSLADELGRILASDRLPTDHAQSPESILAEALDRLTRLAGENRPVALGVAAPGPLSYAKGCLLEVPNMPRWQHFPLVSWLGERAEAPVAMMNDANASVLAEACWGAARGADTAVFLTMSTGMGAGLLLGGRVFEGPLALAGEIGHLRLRDDGPVGFGKRGSVEGYLSGPGMVQVAEAEARIFTQTGRETALSEGPITPKRLCELARAGDPAAVSALDHIGDALGRLCALLIDLLNPDVIVMGTIGTAYPDLFVDRARAVIQREAIPQAAAHVRIVPSGLEDRGNQTAAAVAHRLQTEGPW